MCLTNSQKKYVNKLFNAFLHRKENGNIDDRSVFFKAPTGSGKTFMASEFISKIFSNEIHNSRKTIVVVATVSNANLPKQFRNKLERYRQFHDFQNYKIEYIQSPSLSKNNKFEDIPKFDLEDNKSFVFGTSSFGKNTLFFHNKTLETFTQEAQSLGYQIIFIRDEAHIGVKEKISKNELQSFDNQMKNSASFILEMTATPKRRINLIQMQKDDMEEDGIYLLKGKLVKSSLVGEISDEELIDNAISTFIDVRKKYQELKDVIINPALLIQVSNQTR